MQSITFILVFVCVLFLFILVPFQVLIANGQTENKSDYLNELTDSVDYNRNGMLKSPEVLGIVENKSFFSTDTKNPMLLTTVFMQEASTPESGAIDLDQYEGQVILISYQQSDGDIVWGAEIVDVAGPILSVMVKKVFGFE